MTHHGVLLQLSYLGTPYSGWQKQPGIPTIQGKLEEAIVAISPADEERANGADTTGKFTFGASRTDAGVHAAGQLVSFFPTKQLLPKLWVSALNAKLPVDISVKQTWGVPLGYNPRFDVAQKHYRYTILGASPRDPFLHDRAWHFPRPFVWDKARAAVLHLLGTHDFTTFSSADDAREYKIRTLTKIEITELETGAIILDYYGDAFLKNMIRILTGTLAEIAWGKMSAEAIPNMLASKDRTKAGMTAPAHGLCLMHIQTRTTHTSDFLP